MGVKDKLLEVLERDVSNPHELIECCRILALAYLKKKVQAGDSYILNLTHSLEDLAWDCIADLFERDEANNYVQIERYFRNDIVAELSNQQVQIKLRRLVFSKVNDGLFRNLGVFDMSLSKIIRNLKLAADQQNVTRSRHGKDNYIMFTPKEHLHAERPLMPPEFLEIKLTNRLKSIRIDMPEVLNELNYIFRDQVLYQKKYPIVQLARIIRRSFINLHDKIPQTHIPSEPIVRKEKLQEYMLDSLSSHKNTFYETYVDKGKIEANILERYINSVERILKNQFITDNKGGDSYFDHFKKEFPSISKKEYREEHRQYLEYMVKLVRENFINKLRKVI